MDREPLYQRLERLTRNRRLYVASLWAIGAVVVAVPVAIMVWTGVQFGNPFVSGFAAYIAVVLGGGLLIRRSLERRFGREQRTRTATRLSSKTRWPALNRALSDYAVRAGVEPGRDRANCVLEHVGELVGGQNVVVPRVFIRLGN